MSTLYITEQDAVIRKRSETILVEASGKELLEIELFKVDTICLFGNVEITTPAITKLLENDIELAFFTLNGKLKGQLTPVKSKNVYIRMAQYEIYKNEKARFDLALQWVQAKMKSSIHLVKNLAKNEPIEKLSSEIELLEKSLSGSQSAENIGSLLGYEGSAARAYFSAFQKLLKKDYGFKGRSKHPTTDIVNSTLSFGYTLLGNEIAAFSDGIGFDPYIGFLHELDYGRQSLAQDILELFRAYGIDRLTVKLFNLGILNETHFETGNLFLNREGKRKYFKEYEEHLNAKNYNGKSIRDIYREEFYALGNFLTKNTPYQPYLFQ